MGPSPPVEVTVAVPVIVVVAMVVSVVVTMVEVLVMVSPRFKTICSEVVAVVVIKPAVKSTKIKLLKLSFKVDQ